MSSSTLTNEQYAWITLYTLLGIVFFFALASIPRVIARFSCQNAWSQGWILRFTPPSRVRDPLHRQPSARRLDQKPFSSSYGLEKSTGGGGLHSRYAGAAAYTTSTSLRQLPKHIPSWSTVLHPWLSRFPLLSKRILGVPTAKLVVLLGYALLIAIMCFIFSDPAKNPNRAGWIAVSQFPVAVALSNKNSLVGMLVGKGYERLNYIHRWVGKVMFVATLFHVVSYLVKWTANGMLSSKPQSIVFRWGLVALGGMTLLASGAIPAVRRRYFTIFTYAHWVGFVVMIIATCYHTPHAVPYSLGAAGLAAFDCVLRLIQSHYMPATVHYVPELNSTRVTIPALKNGWRAGQHVRLCVPSTAMGVGMFESHPFTIASCSDDEEGVVLYCKAVGDWTKKLAVLARGGPNSRPSLAAVEEAGRGAGRSINVLVQGPYGGPGNAVLSSYSGAMFVCGGAGITFGLSATNEIMREAFDRSSRVRLIDLVWIVQDPSSIESFLPAFHKLLEQAAVITSVSLRINVHYTRATPKSLSSITGVLPDGLTVVPGRPDVKDMLFASMGCVSVLKSGTREGVHGMVLGVCGPPAMAESVRNVEMNVGRKVREAIGGLELIEEAFSF